MNHPLLSRICFRAALHADKLHHVVSLAFAQMQTINQHIQALEADQRSPHPQHCLGVAQEHRATLTSLYALEQNTHREAHDALLQIRTLVLKLECYPQPTQTNLEQYASLLERIISSRASQTA
jgi:hypothetical protein